MSFSGRVSRAAADLLSRPAFYWALAAIFALRVAVLSIINHKRPNAEGMWEGASAYLTNPAHMYDAAAQYLAASHVIAPPGTIYAFVSPPPVALLAIPVALLPKDVGVQVWTAIDAAALLAGLFILYRIACRTSNLGGPVFWVVAMYFPPVFADISAGQRGGVALLGAMASIWFESRRPWIAGALGGLEIVERDHGGQLDNRGGDAFALGHGGRLVWWTHQIGRRLHRHHERVVVAVVRRFHLDQPLAAGEGTRDADRVERRLGAGVGEAPLR